MEIFERIVQLISDKGVTPYKISADTGINQAILSRIINGTTKKPQYSTLKILAEYFNVSLEWLQTGEGEKQIPKEDCISFADDSAITLALKMLNEQLRVKDEQIAELHRLLAIRLKGDAHEDVASADVG